MKYGEHLKANIAPEYGAEPYLRYSKLDQIIRDLSEHAPSSANLESRQVSLTTPPQTNAQGLAQSSEMLTEESFLKALEEEMVKVESFTLQKVTELRQKLSSVEGMLSRVPQTNVNRMLLMTDDLVDDTDMSSNEEVSALADEIADDFLRLEKYVNINFMGFHKILKKHDKWLPNNPCKQFYVNRMHAQAWVRGDYSDLVVRLSHIYSTLRQDHAAKDDTDATNQSFLRSTTKYWVKTEDVSRVKYAILRHLPLFLQKTSTGESDSQFTNSVYLDNDQLELYHGRLDKTPGAIALRLRWYGTGDPKLVFVERKTHHDKWTGESSVKERFVIDESEVQQLLTNTYPIEEKKKEMLAKGKSDQEVEEWETLAREVTQVIASKQLVPTMRTQCMRTAFQIPFDATVRISLDTNLCMISERGYDLKDMSVWHRDPSWVLQPNEIHRFPHAVLEVKLQLSGGNMTPPKWVTDLQNSGWLYECHKYSKYVHGCSVLLPDDVISVPYWIDDVSLREAVIASGGSRILVDESVGTGVGATSIYTHLLPFGDTVHDHRETAVGRTAGSKLASQGLLGDGGGVIQPTKEAVRGSIFGDVDNYDKQSLLENEGVNFYSGDADWDDERASIEHENEFDDTCCAWVAPFCSPSRHYDLVVAPTSIQKIEPKIFFANERTFLHWCHHAVVLSSIASGVLAFSSESGEKWSEYYAMALLPISLGFIVYALNTYLWRTDRIKTRIPGRWDDPNGPLLLGGSVAVVLIINFTTKLIQIVKMASVEASK